MIRMSDHISRMAARTGSTPMHAVMIVMLLGMTALCSAQSRFPRPEFQNGYQMPTTSYPVPRSAIFGYLDVAVVAVALSLASWLALRRRSRRGIFLLMIACLAYLGFYRKGCICPIGAIQNISLALIDPAVTLSPIIVALFFLPLIFALLFGRVFCSSVCPLGGIQDLVAIRPKNLPPWIERTLGLLPHVMLGGAVLLAATGAGFIICRTDPFVGIFRRSAPASMILWGAIVLLIGTVIARPYCRFLCPLGVVLGWMSRLSFRHVTISPAECVNCRLCETSCPHGAIRIPVTQSVPENRSRSVQRVVLYSGLLPVWIALGGIAGHGAGGLLAMQHHVVRLAHQIEREEGSAATAGLESSTFRGGTATLSSLRAQARRLRETTGRGAVLLGAYLGLVVGISLLRYSLHKPGTEYVPDRGRCISCARCFQSCPIEHRRLAASGKETAAHAT